MNVSLPDAMRAWVEQQVEGGGYANVSDYIRDLIRHDQDRRAALRAEIRQGLNSGRSTRKADDIRRAVKSRLNRG